MKTMIKKGCKQLKLLKKVEYMGTLAMRIGIVVTSIGYLGFALTMMKLVGPNLMITSFLVGLPFMIAGSLMNETAVYQQMRLRAKFRRYSEQIHTLLLRYESVEDGFDEVITPADYHTFEPHLAGHHSMSCSGV